MDIQFGIVLVLILLSTILLWILIGGKGWWWAKATIIVVTLYIMFGIYYLIPDLLGHPSSSMLPNTFEIHWVVVHPAYDGNKGHVDIWARDLGYDPETASSSSYLPLVSKSESRLHRFPYTPELHKQVNEILKSIKSGKPFYGKLKEGMLDYEGKGKEGDGKKGKGKGSFSQEQVPMFYELPPPKFPPKDE